jgi:hypothetical protein
MRRRDTVYLSIKELQQFEKLKLNALWLDKVRDLFLIVLYWFEIFWFYTNTTRKYKRWQYNALSELKNKWACCNSTKQLERY